MVHLKQVFDTIEVVQAITNFISIVKSVDDKLNTLLESKFNAGMSALEQAMQSTNEQESLLREARNRFNEATHLEQDNKRKALAFLGLALCHEQLEDPNNSTLALRKIVEIENKSSGFLGSFFGSVDQELRELQDSVYEYFEEKSPWQIENEINEAKERYQQSKYQLMYQTEQAKKSCEKESTNICKLLITKIGIICGNEFKTLFTQMEKEKSEIQMLILQMSGEDLRAESAVIRKRISEYKKHWDSQIQNLLSEVNKIREDLTVALAELNASVKENTEGLESEDLRKLRELQYEQKLLSDELEETNSKIRLSSNKRKNIEVEVKNLVGELSLLDSTSINSLKEAAVNNAQTSERRLNREEESAITYHQYAEELEKLLQVIDKKITNIHTLYQTSISNIL